MQKRTQKERTQSGPLFFALLFGKGERHVYYHIFLSADHFAPPVRQVCRAD
jgi:hypothetical protein